LVLWDHYRIVHKAKNRPTDWPIIGTADLTSFLAKTRSETTNALAYVRKTCRCYMLTAALIRARVCFTI